MEQQIDQERLPPRATLAPISSPQSSADTAPYTGPPRIVMLGSPGAGKGTQCARLAEELGIAHISTGALLRDLAIHQTPLGLRAEMFMNGGHLVPDDLILELLQTILRLPLSRRRGFVLDGFPRTIAQGEALTSILEPSRVDIAIALLVGADPAASRLRGRARPDDSGAAIKRRLDEYEHANVPLLEWLKARTMLIEVDGDRPAHVVTRDLLNHLAPTRHPDVARDATRGLEHG